jgi:hypothetical protein
VALDSYTSIKTAVSSNWMHRSDLTSTVDDFIDLFESSFNSEMRVRQMERSTSTTSTSGYLVHPAQWLQWKQLKLAQSGGYVNLSPISEESQVTNFGRETPGTPRYYKTIGDKTYLYPTPSADAAVQATYYESVTSLSTSQASNWLLAGYPGAYLYGSLTEATGYVVDDARSQVWKQKLLETLNRNRNESDRAEHGSQVLRVRPDIPVR